MTSLKEAEPVFISQWDDEKNSITTDQVITGSNKKIWWICDNGHSWTASVEYRMRGFGNCKKCSSLGFIHPHLLTQWDYEKNDIDPMTVSPGSGKKVWWRCSHGHSWEMVIKNRAKNGQGCPYCSGQRSLKGVNDLSTTHPEWISQWSDKNSIPMSDVTKGSKEKRWWQCPEGHEWKMSPHHRSLLKDDECPLCRSISVLIPQWVKQWHESNELSPQEVKPKSEKIITWLHPECGHTWEQSPVNRSTSVDMYRCPICSGQRLLQGFNDLLTTHPSVAAQWHKENELSPSDVTAGSNRYVMWLCQEGHEWSAVIGDRVRGSGCPQCSHIISNGESEIADIISSWGFSTINNTRKIIPPYEIDIYIPEKKIAIEFNGVYWHSEKYRDNHYHEMKWKMCKDQDIQLITVWEDDWREKPGIIISMLRHKLDVSRSRTIYARSTTVSTISYEESAEFLNEHHIQGGIAGTLYIGLKSDNNLVAVSVWKKNKNTLYLERYATSCTVVGGMGKLLKQGIQYAREHDCTEIVTFADHQVSNGGLYEKLGFRLDKELKPDYMYVRGYKRYHKFNFRKSRFRDDATLRYDESMTEKELADLNGLHRVWDCGKSRYIYDVL